MNARCWALVVIALSTSCTVQTGGPAAGPPGGPAPPEEKAPTNAEEKAPTHAEEARNERPAQPEDPPATPPTPPPTPPVAPPSDDEAIKVTRSKRIGLYDPRHKDDKRVYSGDGHMVPARRTADGGVLYCGHRADDGKLVIAKLSASGDTEWEVVYEKKGFVTYEGGFVGVTPDGDILAIARSYVTEDTNPVLRIVKLSPRGKIIWELQLHRDKWANTPAMHFGKIAEDGSLHLQGHIYEGPPPKSGDRPTLKWNAVVTKNGKLTQVVVGAPIDWAKDEW